MELKDMIEQMGVAFQGFRAEYGDKFKNIQAQLEVFETALARGQFAYGGGSSFNDLKATAIEHGKQFLAWVRKGGDEVALRNLEIQARDGSTLSDPDGGFLVSEELEHNIERLALDSLAMRRLATVKTSTGEYKKPLSKGGAGGGWVAEKGSRDETNTPELTMFAPPMNEVYALPKVTQNLLDMSDFDVAAWLIEEINDVIVSLEGAAFISGNGVGKPKGITTYDTVADASWEYGKVGYVAGGHASLLNSADKLIDLQHALKPVYRQNGTWLMNDTTLSVIRKFKDGEGNYIWRPGLIEGAPDTLLSRPIAIDDNMPSIGANTYPIAFANFNRAYTIVDHTSGMRLLRDPYTQKGWVLFYLTKKVAGGISNFQAIKFLKIAAV